MLGITMVFFERKQSYKLRHLASRKLKADMTATILISIIYADLK